MGSKRPRELSPTERAFLSSTTAKTLGSYAEDDPETHFRNMTRGTCSVCGREFAVRNGRLAWHKFPGSVIVHPRIHRPDHCLGFLFPPLEVSNEGTRFYLGEVSSLLDALQNEKGSDYYQRVERVRKGLEGKLAEDTPPATSPRR